MPSATTSIATHGRPEAISSTDSSTPDQLLVLQMEDLVVRDREGSYARLLAFLGLDDAAEMRTFQATVMTADRAHIGRWTDVVSPGSLIGGAPAGGPERPAPSIPPKKNPVPRARLPRRS